MNVLPFVVVLSVVMVVIVAIRVLDARHAGVLVDREILSAMESGAIVIAPFDRSCLGTNSYDVHLAGTLRVYKRELPPGLPVYVLSKEEWERHPEEPLDTRKKHETIDIQIPEGGYVLEPGELYLASTVERTESRDFVPILNGRSSTGRLGLSIHVTAGTGDCGFRGPWTMELTVVKRLRVHAGDPIGQLLWLTTTSAPLVPYCNKPSAKYNDAGPLPQPSKLHEDFLGEE